jgi:hypothetical protein
MESGREEDFVVLYSFIIITQNQDTPSYNVFCEEYSNFSRPVNRG